MPKIYNYYKGYYGFIFREDPSTGKFYLCTDNGRDWVENKEIAKHIENLTKITREELEELLKKEAKENLDRRHVFSAVAKLYNREHPSDEYKQLKITPIKENN